MGVEAEGRDGGRRRVSGLYVFIYLAVYCNISVWIGCVYSFEVSQWKGNGVEGGECG